MCLFGFTMCLCCLAAGGGDAGALFGSEQNFSKEVDDKANSYFQAIYNRGMSVDRLLDELKKFKDSQIKKERVRNGNRVGFKIVQITSCKL